MTTCHVRSVDWFCIERVYQLVDAPALRAGWYTTLSSRKQRVSCNVRHVRKMCALVDCIVDWYRMRMCRRERHVLIRCDRFVPRSSAFARIGCALDSTKDIGVACGGSVLLVHVVKRLWCGCSWVALDMHQPPRPQRGSNKLGAEIVAIGALPWPQDRSRHSPVVERLTYLHFSKRENALLSILCAPELQVSIVG